ncbi:IS5 family transposase [Micromonospora inyonensis]|uniref:IS5 family transposase n=1 Tax=Micromonospora inyonensis TaxID=47866 RepID=UPI003CCC0BBB
MPASSGRGRPPKWTKRQMIDGIRWRVRTGTPWRDVPEAYPPGQILYEWFRRWQRDGTWADILAELQADGDAAGRIGWTVSVDSTVSRAHQHAAGPRRDGHAQKEPPGGLQTEPADHGLGRSRGGLTTKTHLACEQGRKPLAMVITGGQRGDSPEFIPVLRKIRVKRVGGGRPRTRPDLVLADKAYTSKGNRGHLRARDQGVHPEHGRSTVSGLVRWLRRRVLVPPRSECLRSWRRGAASGLGRGRPPCSLVHPCLTRAEVGSSAPVTVGPSPSSLDLRGPA